MLVIQPPVLPSDRIAVDHRLPTLITAFAPILPKQVCANCTRRCGIVFPGGITRQVDNVIPAS
jgi:hypothetical protein